MKTDEVVNLLLAKKRYFKTKELAMLIGVSEKYMWNLMSKIRNPKNKKWRKRNIEVLTDKNKGYAIVHKGSSIKDVKDNMDVLCKRTMHNVRREINLFAVSSSLNDKISSKKELMRQLQTNRDEIELTIQTLGNAKKKVEQEILAVI